MHRYLVKISPYLVLLVAYLLHLPFLSCDPDALLSTSSGPFTDEGLYTFQIRNLINSGHLEYSELSTFVKSPMLSLLLLLPFTLLGTDLEIARLTLLTICFISLAYLAKDSVISNIILPFALITLLQYHVFQSSLGNVLV